MFNKNTNALVGIGFTAGIGLIILSKFQDNSAVNGTAAGSAIGEFITAISDIAGWMGIVVLIMVGVYLMKSYKTN